MAGTNLGAKVTSTLQKHLTENMVNEAAGAQPAILATCLGSPPTTANTFQHGCMIIQLDGNSGSPSIYQNTGSFSSPTWTLMDTALPGDTASSLIDTNSVTALDVGTTASAVNNGRITNAATGGTVIFSAVGADTNIPVQVAGKGTGLVKLGQATSTGVQLLADQPLVDSSGNEFVKFSKTASAVNEVTVTNAATGGVVSLTATGDDTNIPLSFGVKGSGKLSLTGTGAKVTPQDWNYIASETGANNAIAGALTDAAGTAVPLAAGLRVIVKLGHTLQAGANTFNLNGGGAVNIKSSRNVANNIGTAYAATGVIDLLYDGTQWVDMSQ